VRTKGKKVNSRWTKGAQRYDKRTQDEIDKKYHEERGWHHGARVTRR
jgi:hypothetical protein